MFPCSHYSAGPNTRRHQVAHFSNGRRQALSTAEPETALGMEAGTLLSEPYMFRERNALLELMRVSLTR